MQCHCCPPGIPNISNNLRALEAPDSALLLEAIVLLKVPMRSCLDCDPKQPLVDVKEERQFGVAALFR